MKFVLEKNIKLFYFLSAVILISVLVIFYNNTQKVKSASESVEHTQEVLSKSDKVLLDVVNTQVGFRGYLLTGNEIFLEPYNNALNTTNSTLAELKELTKDNSHQQLRLDTLKKVIDQRFAITMNTIEDRKQNALSEKEEISVLEKGKILTDKIKSIIADIDSEEFVLLKQRKLENEKSNNNFIVIFLTLVGFIVVIFALVISIIRSQKIGNNKLEELTAAQKVLSNYSLSLIEASRDPLFTISAEGKVTDINEATVRVTGESREKIIGSDFYNYFTEIEKARDCYRQIFEKGFVVDFPLTIHDGKPMDVLCNGSVYKDDAGNVIGVVIVARDVTDQKIIEKDLTEAKVFAELATGIAEQAQSRAESATQIAEDAVKAKQQFLSNMSHEIRTPMNAIIGFTKVVLKTDLTAKQKEYLHAIKMSGDALIVLINDILDLAKVDSGKMIFEETPFKLSASISAMLHLFEPKIQEKNLMLVKEYDNKIPEILLGDPVRLHQIILNLVSNAVKFTTEGHITVSVRLINEDKEKAMVEFAVTDTGIGIAENKLGKIFENFQQASSGTSRLYGGTGLGLAIVKQLVEPQGGTIRVESKVGEGTTFSFILSFKKTTIETIDETILVELDTEIKNIKVLVVEDIALNQLLMKTLLDDFGFEREVAANGRIAIEKLQAKSYDIILMDLQMPEMNGFEATDYIRNVMNSKIPIIALTADVTTVDLAKCKAVGMNDYIAKPVDEKLLYSKIMGLVKKPSFAKLDKFQKEDASKLKCIDLDYLIRRTKSNPKLMIEMISLYLEQTPPLIKAMKQSLQNKDWSSLHAAVHKMIPSFSIMGISTDFENMAKKIQEYASTQQQTDGIPDLVLQLETICAQACIELTHACRELQEEFNATTEN